MGEMQELERQARGGGEPGVLGDAARVRIAPREPFLADRDEATNLRGQLLDGVTASTVVIDLGSLDFVTISSSQALIADWLVATRARRPLVAIIATPNVDVIESVDAALRKSKQSAYWVKTAEHLEDPQIIGDITDTNQRTLSYFKTHVQATAVEYAEAEPELKANAATQRLVDLTGRGLLLRQGQPGRVGDLFVYPFPASPNGKRNGKPAAKRPAGSARPSTATAGR